MQIEWTLPLGQLTPTTNTAIEGPTTQGAPVGGGAISSGTPAATTTAPGSTTQPAPASPLSSLMNFAPIILMFVVLYFILFRGQKKEEKKRQLMVSEMKKGDTVMTIGGLIAKVVSVEGDNVVLKIDESTNVKATYTKRSIQQVLSAEDKAK